MAPGRTVRAINSGDSGNPAGGRWRPMGGIHSLYCTVLYSGPEALSPWCVRRGGAPNLLPRRYANTSPGTGRRFRYARICTPSTRYSLLYIFQLSFYLDIVLILWFFFSVEEKLNFKCILWYDCGDLLIPEKSYITYNYICHRHEMSTDVDRSTNGQQIRKTLVQ